MKDKRVIAAIDRGSGYTKWAIRTSRGELRTGVFISIAPLASKLGKGEGAEIARVNVEGANFIVGPGCLTYHECFVDHRQVAWGHGRHVDQAAVAYCLAAMNEPVIDHLVLGQAPGYWIADLTAYEGNRIVPVLADRGKTTRTVAVRLVSVMNPATAAFLGASAHQPNLLEAREQTLLLQLGYSSLVFHGPKSAYTHSGTVMGGMLRVYDALNSHLGTSAHVPATIPHVKYELAQAGCVPLRWNGRELDFDGELAFALPQLDVYLAEVARRVGPLNEVRNVVVTGGAASLLARRKFFHQHCLPEPYVPPHPQFATVLGYLASVH